MTAFFVWIAMGIIVGVGTRLLDDQKVKGGMVLSVILGIVGAIILGYIAKFILGPGTGALDTSLLLSSLCGAVATLLLQRMFLKSDESPENGQGKEQELSPQPTAL